MKQSWYNSRTSHGGTVEHVMVGQWNRDGETWYDGNVGQSWWYSGTSNGKTVELLMEEECNI